jgi:3-phenylpropionate/trans-cinnamate dioxygenase ferredoxin reductase component
MQVVIVGGGLAGLRTAEELRAQDFSGQITMLAAESRPPYDRPPLSKRVLAGAAQPEPAQPGAAQPGAAQPGAAQPGELLAGEADPARVAAELDTTLRADFAALGVDLHLGEPATGLHLVPSGSGGPGGSTAAPAEAGHHGGPGGLGHAAGTAGRVRTARGEYPFDRLVVATGAEPVALPGPGRQRFLRTHADALELRARLRPGVRLVVVGAGWIGAELATAAAARGCQVTVVEAGPAPLAGAVGAEVGARTIPWYAAAGVALRTSQPVDAVKDGGLALTSGDWIPADEIVTAVGVRPAVGWLAGSGLRLDNGVAADEGLRTSAPGVYAVGDCASFLSLRYGRRLRFEHWDVAVQGPRVVAANILGGQEVYDPVPYSWSEQFGRMMQYAGYHADASRLIWRGPEAGPAAGSARRASGGSAGPPDEGPWTACWLSGPRLVAVLAVDRPRDVVQGRRLIAAAASVDPGLLADPAVPLRSAAVN